ncbi:MAG TPA: PAS domain S-box protein, partial [Candidatus Limnocylindria bacterium]|nr:PAS domain S-box protein [Candidatus Limnocylindria bacterium]
MSFFASVAGGQNEIYVSPQIEALLGFSQEEWINEPVLWWRQTHPEDRDRVSLAFAATCVTGQPFRDVFRVLTRNGETVWVHAEARLVRDEQGRPLFLQGVGFDVTEQRRAQETREQLIREQAARAEAEAARRRAQEQAEIQVELNAALREVAEERERRLAAERAARAEAEAARDAALRLAAIVESSDDAVIGKTLEGIVTSWNPGAERLYGYTAEEMVGQSIGRIFPPDRPDELSNILARLSRGERIEHFETVRRRKDGSLVDVSVTVSPVRDAGDRVVGASAIARDVTERRRVEAERERLLASERAARAEAETLHRVGQALSA